MTKLGSSPGFLKVPWDLLSFILSVLYQLVSHQTAVVDTETTEEDTEDGRKSGYWRRWAKEEKLLLIIRLFQMLRMSMVNKELFSTNSWTDISVQKLSLVSIIKKSK